MGESLYELDGDDEFDKSKLVEEVKKG